MQHGCPHASTPCAFFANAPAPNTFAAGWNLKLFLAAVFKAKGRFCPVHSGRKKKRRRFERRLCEISLSEEGLPLTGYYYLGWTAWFQFFWGYARTALWKFGEAHPQKGTYQTNGPRGITIAWPSGAGRLTSPCHLPGRHKLYPNMV